MKNTFHTINVHYKALFYLLALVLIGTLLHSCGKDSDNRWKIDIEKPAQKVVLIDISKEFYDSSIATEIFKEKYPWFQGTVSDEDLVKRRTDTLEIKIYKEALSALDLNKIRMQYEDLFAHIQHYFPKFRYPKVYLYSSALQSAKDPVFYVAEDNLLFVDITGFMGEKNKMYDGLDEYFRKSMNSDNLIPKSSLAISQDILFPDPTKLKFIDKLVYSGKMMTMQDAFLPDTPDHLKINYSKGQYQWAVENEANIWDYFIENDLLFSDDQRLDERFLNVGPFSKFYTEIDRESSPQIGIFTGWQICRNFFQKKPDTKLQDFLRMEATEIFNQSEYKPKN